MHYKGQRILITGGTGSCGHQLIYRLLKDKPKEIVVLSRDEKKHFDMKYELRDHPEVTFLIGDVRDKERVDEAMSGIDTVFHTAAMKHVTQCEENVMEAVKTNVQGTHNVVYSALDNGVKRLVSLSTDKAVEPVNVMGMTKALGERIVTEAHFSARNKGTKLCCVRYGNVMNSRGSVIPFFRSLLEKDKELLITDLGMTRFLLTLGDAIDLVLFAADNMEGGEIYVRKAPGVYIKDLAAALADEHGKQLKYRVIGTFPGEKINEVLVSANEKNRAEEKDKYWIIHHESQEKSKADGGHPYCSNDDIVAKERIAELLKRADSEYRAGLFEQDTFEKELK